MIRVTASQVKVGRNSDVPSAKNLPEGNYLATEVSDIGCGMTSDVRAKLFDPFFTTKGPGRGLGLALIQGIARADGTVKVRTAPGQGTTFQALLPCNGKRQELMAKSLLLSRSNLNHAQLRFSLGFPWSRPATDPLPWA